MKYSRLIFNMSSEKYHSTPETVSSSQLKDLLDDPEEFYVKHVIKSVAKESNDNFDIGTYVHTALLEPELLDKEIKVYPGKVRSGHQWEKFKKKHKGKCIITLNMKERSESYVAAAKRSPITMARLAKGKSEVSLFIRLGVCPRGNIYALDHDKIMTSEGWEDGSDSLVSLKKKGIKLVEIVVKVRADRLTKKYIVDIKTTSGNAKSRFAMRSKISAFSYDLSASFYLDMFSLVLHQMEDFIWAFISKDRLNAKSWKASLNNKKVGRAKWMRAIRTLAKYKREGWEFSDSMGVLEPEPYQLEWLEPSAEELL